LQIADLAGHGMIAELDGGRIAATPEGAAVLDALVADLAA
jgi:oxygen-independent coproporphyrinogen-3 oxidase